MFIVMFPVITRSLFFVAILIGAYVSLLQLIFTNANRAMDTPVWTAWALGEIMNFFTNFTFNI